MSENRNYLIGYGERLTSRIAPRGGGGGPNFPYTTAEAVESLLPMVRSTSENFSNLPADACPDDNAVAILTLHPQFYAKSYYPAALLREAKLEQIGSRSEKITPRKWTKKTPPQESSTTQLFVATRRRNFDFFLHWLPKWNDATRGSDDLRRIERIRPMVVQDKIHPIQSTESEPLFEVVLHMSGTEHDSDDIIDSFRSYLDRMGVKPDIDRRFEVGKLCFMPLRAPKQIVNDIALFTFLRIIREMPKIRPFTPIRSAESSKHFSVKLPDDNALDPNIKVAIFDGGIPEHSDLSKWATAKECEDAKESVSDYLHHGFGVTSAFLFGPLSDRGIVSRPFANVDHHRVLDRNSGGTEESNEDLYDVLHRIRKVLQGGQYSFFNLSLGPDLPIDDDDVHGWTAVLDDLIFKQNMLATIAVGNNGECDRESGNARIQVPSDCVNGFAVGAANSRGSCWKRADYSAIGPGRRPGIIKPDVLGFGGCSEEPFYVLDENKKNVTTCSAIGTSFASPEILRMAVGVRAVLGYELTPLTIKTLLIHTAEKLKDCGARSEVGWGRVTDDVEKLITCEDASIRVVYQGSIAPAQYLQIPIPVPESAMDGNVFISATFCLASATDPEDPSNYTRAGFDIVFRPDRTRLGNGGIPKSAPFFKSSEYQDETDCRKNAHKWETTLHNSVSKRGESLCNPAFEIHYNARGNGAPTQEKSEIKYSLIITVKAAKIPDIYDQVLRRYRTTLQPLQPVIQIPVTTQIRSDDEQ